MPLYEIFSTLGTTRGVYEYADEASMINFMKLFPNVGNLLYHEVNEIEAQEIRLQIKEKVQKRVNKIMFELWGQQLLED
jgi:hypothetical protein